MTEQELDEVWDLVCEQIVDLPGICGVGMIDDYIGVIIRDESFRSIIPTSIRNVKVNVSILT